MLSNLLNIIDGVKDGKINAMSLKLETKISFLDNKIFMYSEVKGQLSEKIITNKPIVFTNGCFDILHLGHLYLLNKAKELGGTLIVGMNSDSSIRIIKGDTRPILPQEVRSYQLSILEVVDNVIIFEQDALYELIQEVCPNILVKGSDWKGKRVIGEDIVIKHGGKIVFIDNILGISTTEIVHKINSVRINK